MLEILLVWFIATRLQRTAMGKGLPRSWGALAFLWFAGEVVGAMMAAVLGARDMVYPIALVGAVLGAASAFVIVTALPARPGWNAGMRWAGWCKKCKANVWVTPEAKCQNGHGLNYLTRLYVPPQPMGAAAQTASVEEGACPAAWG